MVVLCAAERCMEGARRGGIKLCLKTKLLASVADEPRHYSLHTELALTIC
jgi:hypothetical protein